MRSVSATGGVTEGRAIDDNIGPTVLGGLVEGAAVADTAFSACAPACCVGCGWGVALRE